MAIIKDLRKVLGSSFDFGTNDRYNGTADDDFVYLYGGNDFFNDIAGGKDSVFDLSAYPGGNSGNDVVSTGVGDDIVTSSLDSTNAYYGGLGTDFISVGACLSGCRIDLAAGTALTASYNLITTIAGFENIYGSNYSDTFYGDSANNVIWGFAGENFIDGRSGNDKIYGGNGVDRLHGGADNDFVYGGENDDFLYGEAGNDSLQGWYGNDRLYGGAGDDTILDTGAGNEIMYGDAGLDLMRGGEGNDLMFGGTEGDDLGGNVGNDTLEGGAGADNLDGGAGFDRFVYRALSESPNTNVADIINGFEHNIDDIDVSLIDANAGVTGNQAFTFIGNVSSFTNAGQIRTFYDASRNEKLVMFNTDSDQAAEMVIYLKGNIALTSTDFIL